MSDFHAVQTQTGWSKVLQDFADWCRPRPGWRTLDVGTGSGMLPAMFSLAGCQAYGIEIEPDYLRPEKRLHPLLTQADAGQQPFPACTFQLVTASNVLFLLPDPQAALVELRRLLKPGGIIALLNPSERMSSAAASALVERRGLQGVARDSMLNWAARAECTYRWSEADLQALLAPAGLRLVDTRLMVGPGLARTAKAIYEDGGCAGLDSAITRQMPRQHE